MSTHYSALYVAFENPMSEEETELLRRAILQLRGVLSVDTSETDFLPESLGAMRERHEMTSAILDLLRSRNHT